ncbi:anti-sigma factor family protein [Novosphingobium sp. BL-52-GroH]|uniref:anti-sigma factor family protein n=1 Tax=Novosphingobium sp. BL-52-GroH TaxID=3349877 RepID=UPI0038501228
MNVTDDELMAFADGELSGADAERVAAAIAADPALTARIEAERRLRTMLRGHFDPIAAEPVPESLTLMVAAAAADETERDMTDAPAPPPRAEPARVLDFAAARARRQAEAKAAKAAQKPQPRNWGTGAAIAASLVLGVILGTQFAGRGAVTERGGALVASGALATGLDMELASAGTEGKPLRILASFKRAGGDYCRVFDGGATAGIACKAGHDWVLERTVASGPRDAGAYRQAGSAQGDLMAAAQGMASGEPLDAAQERAARMKSWSK